MQWNLPEMEQQNWGGDCAGALEKICRVAVGCGPLHLLRGGERIALGLPRDRKAAEVVLGFYQPQRLKGRLFHLAAVVMLKLGAHRHLLTPHVGSGEPEVEWLRESAERGLVGFLGCNPAHGLRCIVGGLLAGKDRVPFVGKLGFGRSGEAIVREAEVLESLGGKYEGVPDALALERGTDWVLLRLPFVEGHSPKSMVEQPVVDLLGEWLGEGMLRLGEHDWAADILSKAERSGVDAAWCERMRQREVRSALVHGDFAPWNLRVLAGKSSAIDWEWAVEDGIGGVDLAHGLRQEALLVRGMDHKEAVKYMLAAVRTGGLHDYLGTCGWGDAHEDWLRFGVLASHGVLDSSPGVMLEVFGDSASS